MEKNNTVTKASIEFDILEKNVEGAIISPYRDEILALVEKFGDSGQSGGSAPYTAGAISNAVKNLCLQKPLYGIMNFPEEWMDVTEMGGGKVMYQNNRLSAVFKNSKEGKPYYIDAIVFQGQSGSAFTSSSVDLKDGGTIGSAQYIKKFPFKPKTFYIDVIETEWADKNETVEQEGGGWWTSIIKDEAQLKEVFEYYDEFKKSD